MISFEDMLAKDEQKSVCIVRLSTSYWSDSKGIYTKKSITWLRRKSLGFSILEEDASAIGVDEVTQAIENLYDVCDGVYEVVTCNEHRDYETGYIDSYDYKLVKVKQIVEQREAAKRGGK